MKGIILLAVAWPLFAQPDRLFAPIDTRSLVALKCGVNPRVQYAQHLGPLPDSENMSGLRLWIPMSTAQKADQVQLLEDTSNPASPNYRKTLTPEQVQERFGLSDNDRARIAAWLERLGFHIEKPQPIDFSSISIRFSGTAAQVKAAFRIDIHRYYQLPYGPTRFSYTTCPSVPAVLAPLIEWVDGLSDFPITGAF